MQAPPNQPVQFVSSDGVWLPGDLFAPQGPARCAVLITSAMGVRRQLYAPFASFLADSGMSVLTFDYRGIGQGRPAVLPRYHATLSDWAEKDIPAALHGLSCKAPGLPLLYVGHSLGGQLLGLVRNNPARAALLVASQSGYWGNWSGAARLAMGALWFAGVPAATALLGYLPMRLTVRGEDVPAAAANQWAEWGRDRRYVVKYLEQRDGCTGFRFDRPLRAYGFSDDGYAPRRAVEALLRAYPHARSELRFVRPAELGAAAVGHFGAFRPSLRATLWSEMRDWLLLQR
jgi:predicted alpha/beta hydrolase